MAYGNPGLGVPAASTIRLALGAALILVLVLSGCPQRGAPSQGPSAPVGAAAALRFSDAAGPAGLEFTPDRGLKPPLDILQTAGYGGGFLDYDQDGWPDILLVGNPRCRLFRNLRGGRFRDVTTEAGLAIDGHWMGCASSDFDNDGRPDLLLTGYRTTALLHNDGGRFRRLPLAFPADHWGTSAAFFDYDRDGRTDLYIGCYVSFGRDNLRLCGFAGILAACPPTYYDPQEGHLYRNEGGGAFRETTLQAGLARTHGKTLGAAACDFNGDGWPDLYLANDGMPCDLFVNRQGRFEEQGLETGTAYGREGTEQAGMGVDWGDVDGDGRPDLAVTTFQFEPTSLYINGGKGTFREEAYPRGIGDASVTTLGFGARFCDLDNDGGLDLVVGNGHVQDAIAKIQPGVSFAQPVQIFRWHDGIYRPTTQAEWLAGGKPIVGRGVATADYDRDGRVDLLVTNLLGTPLLLHNETRTSNHWLSIRLEPDPGPRDGTGCEVEVQTGGRRVKRFATTGGGYLSCSEPAVHVGLGTASRADRIAVRWPDGRLQEWMRVPSDRPITLRQKR